MEFLAIRQQEFGLGVAVTVTRPHEAVADIQINSGGEVCVGVKLTLQGCGEAQALEGLSALTAAKLKQTPDRIKMAVELQIKQDRWRCCGQAV